MAQRENPQKRTGKAAEAEATVEVNAESTERVKQLGDDVDELLDEIDSVLEENAEEFVRAYVQKGGQ